MALSAFISPIRADSGRRHAGVLKKLAIGAKKRRALAY
jgi:hypothetical protein